MLGVNDGPLEGSCDGSSLGLKLGLELGRCEWQDLQTPQSYGNTCSHFSKTAF